MVNYHVLNESIVLNYNGKTVVVSKSDTRYEPVLQCIRDEDLDAIPAIVEIERGFDGTGIELREGLLYENDIPLPSELSDRILMFKEQHLPYAPLFAFWDNLKKNPSYNARQMLFKFLEHNGHPLTEDGCFIAYRGVDEGFKDKHTGRFDNSPGAICEMPRESVDDNPNNTCSAGLHVACYDYAKGFGEKLVEVKVNPTDVVCVPTDYNGTKMRTCKFEVVREGEKPLQDLLYGHKKVESDESLDDEQAEEGVCPDCEHYNEPGSQYCNDCGETLSHGD